METDKRDEAFLEDIAGYFDMLASDCDAMAMRFKSGKKENARRAAQWRQAASDIRSIKLIFAPTGEQ